MKKTGELHQVKRKDAFLYSSYWTIFQGKKFLYDLHVSINIWFGKKARRLDRRNIA